MLSGSFSAGHSVGGGVVVVCGQLDSVHVQGVSGNGVVVVWGHVNSVQVQGVGVVVICGQLDSVHVHVDSSPESTESSSLSGLGV